MKISILILTLTLYIELSSQEYFSRYFPFDGYVSDFKALIVDRDTIYVQGLFKDTIAPYFQGVVFARIDSSGDLISIQKYYDPLGRDIVYPPLVSINRLREGGFKNICLASKDAESAM